MTNLSQALKEAKALAKLDPLKPQFVVEFGEYGESEVLDEASYHDSGFREHACKYVVWWLPAERDDDGYLPAKFEIEDYR